MRYLFLAPGPLRKLNVHFCPGLRDVHAREDFYLRTDNLIYDTLQLRGSNTLIAAGGIRGNLRVAAMVYRIVGA